MLIIAPVKIVNTLNLSSIAYIVLCLLAFCLGTAMIRSKKIYPEVTIIKVNKKNLVRIYHITFCLGLTGVIFRYMDLFLYRGMSLDNSVLDNFDLAAEGSGNMLSVIASMLVSCVYIPFTLDMICNKLHRKNGKILSFVLIVLSTISSLLLTSRFAIVTPLVYCIIVLFYSGKIKFKISIKAILFLLLCVIVFVNIISSLMIRRMNDMHNQPSSVVFIGATDKVPVTSEFQQLLYQNEGKWAYPYLFAYANITQYSTHAIFEFPIVKEYVEEKGDYFYGSATFLVITKFVAKIFNPEYDILKDIAEHNARPGIWSTFFFLWYLDFRWFGIFMMLLLGYVTKKVWAGLYYNLHILYLPIIVYVAIILFLTLQLNLIAGVGTFALVTFSVIAFLFKDKLGEKILLTS
jgi:hypothetical protein